MSSTSATVFRGIAVLCAVPTAFFVYYGVQLVYMAATFEGEGSLGHVGMYIAAVLFPILALLFGGLTLLAWRHAQRKARDARTPGTDQSS